MTFWQRMGGRKNCALWFSLIITNLIVLLYTYTLQMIVVFKDIDFNMQPVYDFAIKFTGLTVIGIIGYLTNNVVQHIKLKG